MMSTGNAMSDRLDEVLDAAAAESDAGKLDDAEIQRLVALSRDASYRRTERVPVKSIEAFEPRSLVSIAMAAQRRREEEMRFDAAAAAATAADQDASSDALAADGDQSADAAAADMAATGLDADGPLVDGDMPPAPSAGGEDMPAADGDSAVGDAQIDEGQAGAASADAALTDDAQSGDTPSAATPPNIDFEAGHASGLEEGRKVGFDEGHTKGMDEGRAAGRAEASAHLERAIQAFEAATAKLGDLTEIDGGALSKSINDVVLSMASERAGHAIEALPDAFATRIEKLVGTIRTVSGTPVIRLNAADLAAIGPLVETREKLRHCSFIEDQTMARGDLSVTLGTIGIDDILTIDSPEEGPSETVKGEKGRGEETTTDRDAAEDSKSEMTVAEELQDDLDQAHPSDEAENGSTE
ncbi:MAG: FliH/SctL family protein, partial [Pseudomonadota bacterium]|nr:FliH/SctL family protein [Pseudomonadota bacterium]